jgi:hypothetical protein
MKQLKVIIDTNLLISSLLGGLKTKLLYQCLKKKLFKIVFSDELMAEFLEVISRPELSKYIKEKEIEELLELLEPITIFIKPVVKINTCRDPKDNFILELAISGKVDCIITGDKDLLTLHSFQGISILNISEFRKMFAKW